MQDKAVKRGQVVQPTTSGRTDGSNIKLFQKSKNHSLTYKRSYKCSHMAKSAVKCTSDKYLQQTHS
jgi:hypothetical protein